MNTIMTITRLTFHEAWRRWMVIIALALGAVFILLSAIGFGLITTGMRRAAYLMQPPIVGLSNFSPFSAFSVPSPAMVAYGIVYTAIALVLAMRAFSRRDL